MEITENLTTLVTSKEQVYENWYTFFQVDQYTA